MKIPQTCASTLMVAGMLLFTGGTGQAQVGSGSGSGGAVGQGGPEIKRPGTGQEVTPGGPGTMPEFNQNLPGAPDSGKASRPGSGSIGAPGSPGEPGGAGTSGGGTSSPGTGSSGGMGSSGGAGGGGK
ncbi:MAG: hypothetical protein H8K03_21690 [Nitrospira sp.]